LHIFHFFNKTSLFKYRFPVKVIMSVSNRIKHFVTYLNAPLDETIV
jgi:hypothetical protein